LYLVYEIDIESRAAPHTARDSKQGPNGFPAEPLGAYFADNATEACGLAAEQHGRAGVYAAVKVKPNKIKLAAEALGDPEIGEITAPPVDCCDELLQAIRQLKPTIREREPTSP
jgi:hypothetical protein